MWWQDVHQKYSNRARELEERCDWSWAASKNANDLINYKLFLLCKIAANDVILKKNNNRFLLSPTPEIDAIWHEHMLHPLLYVKMCRILNKGKPLYKQIIDHNPDFANDKIGMKRKRTDNLSNYITNITNNKRQLKRPIHQSNLVTPQLTTVPTPSKLPNQDKRILIKVKDSCGLETEYKIGINISFEKLINAYAYCMGLSPNLFRILYNGIRIDPKDTPKIVEMVDGDQLDFMLETVGC